jgi:hypothetical protein
VNKLAYSEKFQALADEAQTKVQGIAAQGRVSELVENRWRRNLRVN